MKHFTMIGIHDMKGGRYAYYYYFFRERKKESEQERKRHNS